MHFAPSANVTLPKLNEEDRTIVVAAPMYGGNFLLTRVNSKGLADDLLDVGQSLYGKKAPCGNGPRRAALRGGMRSPSDASGSCFRADHVLIESEQSMAREDSDGSAVERDVGFEIDKERMGRFLAGGIYERDLFERLDMAFSFIYPFE